MKKKKENTKKLRIRLYKAIENENSTPEQIRQMIDAGALRKLTDKEEKSFCRSPLYTAAQAGRADIVQLLLDVGADVVDFVDNGRYDGYDSGPCTALSVAALWGHTDVVQALIKAAEADEKRLDLEGALCSAVYAGNIDIIRQLLEAGAEVDCPRMWWRFKGQRFRRLARKETFMSLYKAESRDRINFLRWVRRETPYEETPLSLAIKTERWDIIDLLLDAGAEINLAAHGYDTPLGLAARIGDTELMQHLIDRGADINGAPDADTPLVSAAKDGCVESVRFLLDHGADVNAETECGTPLIAGALYAHEQFVPIARILLEAGADVNKATLENTPLIAAARAASVDSVRFLLEAGADVNKATLGYTPLIAAAEEGFMDGVRLFLDAGADVNIQSDFYTPLIAAAEGGNRDIVRLLLDAGADVNAKTEFSTALIEAVEKGNIEIVRMLLDAGADVHATTRDHAPLVSAVEREEEPGGPEVINLLLEAGADVNAEADGTTALMVALARGNLALAHFLRRAGAIDKPRYFKWKKDLDL